MRTASLGALLLLAFAAAPARGQSTPIDQAASTPSGLIEALYRMVSFGPGPEPDWEMFRGVFLPEAVLVVAPRGPRPMRVMDVAGFIQDWRDFFRDAKLEDKGFTETIAGMKVDQVGGLAHAWVIFEPRIGGTAAGARVIRGLDSIELSFDGTRWWVAAITTEFEGPGLRIPPGLVP